MKIATRGKKAYIQTPYHSTFVARIKQISGARWNPKKRAWVVDVEFLPLVRQIMDEIFGESDVPAEDERYNIKLTFHTDISSRPLDGVYFFAKCLAFAYNYGNGARFGDGVNYLSGGCTLRGTIQNWVSVVQAGSVIMVYDVPETLVKNALPTAGVNYEFIVCHPDAEINQLASPQPQLGT